MTGLLDLLALVGLGIAVGGVGTLLGIGGGFILAPVLLTYYGLSPGGAAGTSLVAVLANAISGTTAYLRRGRVDKRLGLVFTLGSVPGSILGAYATTLVSSGAFKAYFTLLLIATAAYIVVRRRVLGGEGIQGRGTPTSTKSYSLNLYTALVSSVASGFVAGFFGVGGGVVHVPVMLILVGIPAHTATATSHFILVFNAGFGLATHVSLGHVAFGMGVPIAIGALAGAQLGARASDKLSSRALELIFAFFVTVISLYILSTA